jgi:formate dehydrogenase subunit delta
MMSNLERLVYMANQIARNLATMGEGAAMATADHMLSFWDPRMKAQIVACLDADPDALDPIAGAAVALLRDHVAVGSMTGATAFNQVNESGHADAG